jgi:hypothetical protein
MPSPFPGMNPYLEQASAWHDFHQSFLPRVRDLLSLQVLPRYFVKIEEHLYVHELDPEQWRFVGRADLALKPRAPLPSGPGSVRATVAPAYVRVPIFDVEHSVYLEIRDREKHELVTVIEMLSPSNKFPGKDRDKYIAKRNDVLSSSTNLVEIDLLRGGTRMPMAEDSKCHYCVLVCRSEEWPQAGFWAISLRDRLPEIPVPLRSGERDATIDLQEVLHHIYDAAGYGYYIYNRQPEPSLSPEDAEWARQFLPQPSVSPEPRKRTKRKRS